MTSQNPNHSYIKFEVVVGKEGDEPVAGIELEGRALKNSWPYGPYHKKYE